MASISEVLDTHGSVEDMIMLTNELHANQGEELSKPQNE